MKNSPTGVLLVEDNPGDARLVREALAEIPQGWFKLTHVDRLSAALGRLSQGVISVVLLDLLLPDSSGLETLIKLRQHAPNVAILVLTAIDDDMLGLVALREGAQDYLAKRQLNGSLLVRSMRYAMERKQMEQEQQKLLVELQAALAQVKLLSGLLPICASCKKIRDDAGYWNQIETYISAHSEAKFTHGICPECMKQLYPDVYTHLFRDGAPGNS